jgi:hypothetical protein
MKFLTLLAIAAAVLPWLVSPVSAQQELMVRAISFQPGFPVEIHAHELMARQRRV